MIYSFLDVAIIILIMVFKIVLYAIISVVHVLDQQLVVILAPELIE